MIKIPVIDIFAGPGGLSEGFSALRDEGLEFPIALSIEKDSWAYRTLQLRTFYREFNKVPEEYYDYLKGGITKLEDLFDLYPEEAEAVNAKVWKAELGKIEDKYVDLKIKKSLKNNPFWVLLGGPPCQAYSTVGRSRMKVNGNAEFEKDDRHYLYKQYLKILVKHKPTNKEFMFCEAKT